MKSVCFCKNCRNDILLLKSIRAYALLINYTIADSSVEKLALLRPSKIVESDVKTKDPETLNY